MSNTMVKKKKLSKKRRVINYMSEGRGLTEAEARSRFGVCNFRAMISEIRSQVESYGNWVIAKEETSTGKSRYFMDDTYSGKRTYGFDKNGKRYIL